MKETADYLINIPSTVTPRIQQSHILVGHIICEAVEAEYSKENEYNHNSTEATAISCSDAFVAAIS